LGKNPPGVFARGKRIIGWHGPLAVGFDLIPIPAAFARRARRRNAFKDAAGRNGGKEEEEIFGHPAVSCMLPSFGMIDCWRLHKKDRGGCTMNGRYEAIRIPQTRK